jgi:ATP-dependent 26S proteasome regulatory subunit
VSLSVPNEAARTEILKKLTKNMRLKENFPFEDLVLLTPGFVGADI